VRSKSLEYLPGLAVVHDASSNCTQFIGALK